MQIDLSEQTFSLSEVLSVAGIVQSTVILVYIVSRTRDVRQALPALGYFFFLAAFFALHFARLRIDGIGRELLMGEWLCLTSTAPLSYLLIMQVAKRLPRLRYYHLGLLLVAPLGFALVYVAAQGMKSCVDSILVCGRFFDLLYWFSGMSGAASVLAVFYDRDVFKELWKEKAGREKYWLVITLISVTVMASALYILRSSSSIDEATVDFISTALQILFAYLVTTTLFRVYPAALQLSPVPRLGFTLLNNQEGEIADKVKHLLYVEKLYQEPAYSRADLAKEVGVSESVLSRIINISFGKSFPRLLAELRVEDAKNMLKNPEIPVQTVAVESGFNSVATFNRVFKELTGETPSSYRLRINST